MSSNDIDKQIEKLQNDVLITEAEVRELCNKAREILIEESNIQKVDTPVTVSPMSSAFVPSGLVVCVCMDVHGCAWMCMDVWILLGPRYVGIFMVSTTT